MTSLPASRSDHFDGERFFNPGVQTDRSLGDLWRWRRTQVRAIWPRHVGNQHFPAPPERLAADEMALTFIGQATYLVRTPGCTILTDPIFSERASPFSMIGPRRVRDPGIPLDRLPRIDLILLSHNHYDHMDLPSLRALHEASKPTIVTGLGNGAYLARKGIPGAVELDWWGTCRPRPDVEITYVPAQHWSSRTMRDRRKMLWGGHVLACPAGQLYFAGDTGYFSGFAGIRARCGAPDVAMLPIGAYEPRWFMKAQHMNPEEAVQAHLELGAGLSVAMHWGTFQLTDEAIDAPVEALRTALEQHGLTPRQFQAPLPGQTVMWRRAGPAPGLDPNG